MRRISSHFDVTGEDGAEGQAPQEPAGEVQELCASVTGQKGCSWSTASLPFGC